MIFLRWLPPAGEWLTLHPHPHAQASLPTKVVRPGLTSAMDRRLAEAVKSICEAIPAALLGITGPFVHSVRACPSDTPSAAGSVKASVM